MDTRSRQHMSARRPAYRSPEIRVVSRRPQASSGLKSVSTARAGVDILVSPPNAKPKQVLRPLGPPVKLTVVHRESHQANHATTSATVSTAIPSKKIEKSKHKNGKRNPRFTYVLYALALVVLGIGGLLAYQAYRTNQAIEKQVATLSAAQDDPDTSTTSLPTDTKPKDPNFVQNYKVGPLVPRLLTIKKLGMTSRVMPIGTDKDGRMDVPKTAYDVGWYTASSRPGEQGAMVIDGHVQGVGGPAVFTKLHTLLAGDVLQIERGDGKKIEYKVMSVETVPADKVDMGKLLVSMNTAIPGLNLITCGGTYVAEKGTFTDRTIVYALQK